MMFILYSLSVILIDVVIMWLCLHSLICQDQNIESRAFDLFLFLFAVVQFIGSVYFLIKHLNP